MYLLFYFFPPYTFVYEPRRCVAAGLLPTGLRMNINLIGNSHRRISEL